MNTSSAHEQVGPSSRVLGRGLSLALACGILLVLGYFATRTTLRTDMRSMMPSTEQTAGTVGDDQLARALVGSAMNQSVIVFFRGDGVDVADLAQRFAAQVRGSFGPRARAVTTGPDARFEEAFYRTYFARRALFWPDDVLRSGDSTSIVNARVETTRANLTSAMSALYARTASEDPTSLFSLGLEHARHAMPVPMLASENGVFRAEYQGQTYSVMLIELAQSPLGSDSAHAIDAALLRSTTAMHAVDPSFVSHVAGIHRFALAAETRIRADITRVSTVSTVFIVALFWLLFRGLRVLLLSMIPLVGGVLAGTVLTQICFGEVHGLALAFGSSLLGVGIDFVAHLASSSVLAAEDGVAPEKTLRNVLPGLLLGASTTVLGLFALAFGTVPALRQLAVFAGGSVAAALGLTLLVLPPWLSGMRVAPKMHMLANGLARLTTSGGRRLSYVALAVGLVVACAGYSQAELVDDIRALRGDERALRTEMEAMQRALGHRANPTLVVATGTSEEQALAVNDRLHRALRSQFADEQVHSIAPFLPSLASQQERQTALQHQIAQLNRQTGEALERADLDATQFSALRAEFVPIRSQELLSGPLHSLLRPFRVVGVNQFHYLTYVEPQGRDLAALVHTVPGAQLFSEAAYLQRAYQGFRSRTASLVVTGLGLVFALCALRYRSAKKGFLAVLPALIASFIAVGVSAWWAHQLHLLHFAAVLMVLSMGEDYAVFMLEVQEARETKGTLVGIFLAAVTTVISFLLLALSREPALASLGQVVSVGIAYSFLLAPMVRPPQHHEQVAQFQP